MFFVLTALSCSTTRPLVDKFKRIIGVLLGRPKNDPTWEVQVTKGLADAMDEVRREGDAMGKKGAWTKKQREDRRLGGQFITLTTGVSYGGGQRVRISPRCTPRSFLTGVIQEPGVLKPQKDCQQSLIDKLHQCPGSRRVAGFASCKS